MRDNRIYRAANGCAQVAILQPSPGLAFAASAAVFPRIRHREEAVVVPVTPLLAAATPWAVHSIPVHWYPFQWYRYHSYGMDTIGMQCIAIQSIDQPIAYQWISKRPRLVRMATGQGKRQTSPEGLFTTTAGN